MQKKKEKVILSTSKYEKDGGKVLRLERLKEVAEESGRIQFGGYIQTVLGLGEQFLAGDGTNPNLIAVFKKPSKSRRAPTNKRTNLNSSLVWET